MYQEQRLSKMLELLEDKGQLAAKDMVDYFQVSKDTIRRDFSILSERKLVQRMAVLFLFKLVGNSLLTTTVSAN